MFCFKTRGEIVSLWPARIRFGSAVQMHIVHAKFVIDFRDLNYIQVWIFIEWLHNKITFNSNISFWPNIWTHTWNIVILLTEFDTKNLFDCCVNNFWSLSIKFRCHTGMPYFQMHMQWNSKYFQYCILSKLFKSDNKKTNLTIWICAQPWFWLVWALCYQFSRRILHSIVNNHSKIVCLTKTAVVQTQKKWWLSIRVCEIRHIIGLWRTHISACFERNFKNFHIIFCGQTNIIIWDTMT